MKLLRVVLYCSGGTLILIFIEGVCTMGTAFDFENYNLFAWIIQALFLICTLAAALMMALEDHKRSTDRKPIEF